MRSWIRGWFTAAPMLEKRAFIRVFHIVITASIRGYDDGTGYKVFRFLLIAAFIRRSSDGTG